jgi:NTP pyrophosphatase (non-canonical NTP hydrolase)
MQFNTFNDYVNAAISTAHFPEREGNFYCAVKLLGETGEMMEKLGKRARDVTRTFADASLLDPNIEGFVEFRDNLALELGDIIWYVAALHHRLPKNSREPYGQVPITAHLEIMQYGTRSMPFSVSVAHLADAAHFAAHYVFVEAFSENTTIDAAGEAPTEAGKDYARMSLMGVVDRAAVVADKLGYSLHDIMCFNITKLQSRQKRGTLGGSGDHR